MNKEFMPKIKSVKTRYRIAKTKQILKMTWDLFPAMWLINALSRVIIAGTIISYLDSQGSLTILVNITLILWAYSPFYGLVNNLYYQLKESCIDWRIWKLNNKKVQDE